jgi:uncharacterized beta-barrel protein YwiB (DUF1934 family)
MGNEVLDTAKFFWDVIKDGLKVQGKTVSVLPKGSTMMDLQGWKGPTSYSEYYDQLSFLFGEKIVDFTLTASWMYNDQYIGNFKVIADGTVELLSSLDVSVSTDEAYANNDGVVQLPYAIQLTFRNIGSGTQQTTLKSIASGDGGGMSVP